MKVSIITVCFNAEEWISDAIESVLNQTYQDIEYIVIDGLSNDGTLDVINRYEERISKILSEKDLGIYDAMNKGISISSGDVIGFVNSDDMLHSDQCIEKVMNNFNEDYDVVYGDIIYVDRNDTSKLFRYWKAGSYDKNKYKYGWMTPHLSTYIKREFYEKYGGFDLRFKIAADYELMLRLLYKNNLRVKYLPGVIAKMRAGGVSNNSILNIMRSNLEVYKSWKVNNLKVSLLIVFIKPALKLKQIFSKTIL